MANPLRPEFLGFMALLHLLLLPLGAAASSLSSSSTGDTIHDVLRAYGLPGGLLPQAVESYSLDQPSGRLEVRLARPCYARFDGMVLFDRVVRANLTYGGLRALVGLSQEELVRWLPVRGILLADPSSGLSLFDIGLAHKQLSLALFEFPPECRPDQEGEGLAGAGDGGEPLKMRS